MHGVHPRPFRRSPHLKYVPTVSRIRTTADVVDLAHLAVKIIILRPPHFELR